MTDAKQVGKESTDSHDLFLAASVIAQTCSEADAKAEQRAALAVSILQQALAHGFANYQRVVTNADLDPLRSRLDFQSLVKDLKENRPAASK